MICGRCVGDGRAGGSVVEVQAELEIRGGDPGVGKSGAGCPACPRRVIERFIRRRTRPGDAQSRTSIAGGWNEGLHSRRIRYECLGGRPGRRSVRDVCRLPRVWIEYLDNLYAPAGDVLRQGQVFAIVGKLEVRVQIS